MNYKSPIELIAGQIETEIENDVVKAVQRVGINIDKAELLRALAYDRNQYTKGYHDRDSEFVRCEDCKYWKNKYREYDMHPWLPCMEIHTSGNWFCGYGEKAENK